jgi:hypothetical protein
MAAFALVPKGTWGRIAVSRCRQGWRGIKPPDRALSLVGLPRFILPLLFPFPPVRSYTRSCGILPYIFKVHSKGSVIEQAVAAVAVWVWL